MRVLFAFACALAVYAQNKSSERSTYTYDVNGRRVLESQASSTSGSGGSTTGESIRTLNGRVAPLQRVEEKVVSDGPEGKVIERIIRRFEGSGGPATSEKVLVETRKNPDGSETRRVTAYEADLNGRFVVRERATEQAFKQGGVERSETVVERPNINGGFETAEKRVSVAQGPETDRQKDVTVYRRSSSGGFGVAQREIEQVKVANGQTTTTSAVYDANSTGQMELATQRVSTVSKSAGGSEVEVIDFYGKTQPGRTSSGGPALREQQVIERKVTGTETVETLSIRRPQVDSGKLGPMIRISETICKGDCKQD